MITYIENQLEDIQNKLEKMSPELVRYYFYKGKITNLYRQTYIVNDDNKVCFVTKVKIPKFNNRIYFKDYDIKGFTYNKTTKKIKMWYGMSVKTFIDNSSFIKFMEIMKLEWFNNMDRGLRVMLSKTLLEQI